MARKPSPDTTGSSASPRKPLAGDPARQAVDSLLGYDYQIWRSVEAWLRLEAGQTLYLECAEDYDVVDGKDDVATQVKNSSANITLNSDDVREAIANFWDIRSRNPDRSGLTMRFLTRGGMGKEKGAPFGAEKGLVLWRKGSSGDPIAARRIKEFLSKLSWAPELNEFLQTATDQAFRETLLARIVWSVEEPSIEATRLSVTRLAINIGNRQGVPPVVAERAVSALLDRCRTTATQSEPELRSLTTEDAQLCFESNSSLPVPITNQLMAAIGAMAGTNPLTFSTHAFDGEAPELPIDGLPRHAFIEALRNTASKRSCLLIVGTESEGKSTAANMLSRALAHDAYWMDLRGGDEPISNAAIENALVLTRSARPPSSIVLDDLPAAQGIPDAIWGRLAVLIAAARRARINLIMTSRGVPADQVDPRFKASGIPVASVPRIDEAEMIEYFLSLGCPTMERAANWARLTLAHSGNGHPKLVHLAGLELRDNGWRAADANALVSAPRSIEEARAHARQSACKIVGEADRQLLFALSLSVGPVERAVALDIGYRLGLTEPGVSFDRLAGRWIESQGTAGYRATPLLNGQAEKIWSADRVREVHATIFDAHIERRRVDVSQAMALFLHAFQAQDTTRLVAFISMAASNLEDSPALAEALELVIVIGDQDHSSAIPFSEQASLLLRFLQFRIAKLRRPEAAAGIAHRWLHEIDRAKDRDLAEAMRAMRGIAVASAGLASLAPATVVQAMQDAAGVERLGIDVPKLSSVELGLDPGNELDAMQFLFLMAQSNIETPAAMLEMIDQLELMDPEQKAHLVATYASPLVREGLSMFDRVMVHLHRQGSEANWGVFADALRRADSVGRTWNAPAFSASATRVLSIVLSEYLGDRVAAAKVLEEVPEYGTTYVLLEQRANVSFRNADFQGALELWERSLSGGETAGAAGVRDPFAMRRAAIAAAKLGKHGRAAAWFEHAASVTATALQGAFPCALFFIDAAYCWWLADDADNSLRSIMLARGDLQNVSDNADMPRVAAARKLLGHLVLWIGSKLTEPMPVGEPAVGFASNPDLDVAALAEMPQGPSDVLDMIVFESAVALQMDQPWLAPIEIALSATKHPAVSMTFHAERFKRLLVAGALSAAATHAYHLYEATLRMYAMRANGVTEFVEFEEEQDDAAWAREGSILRNCLLQALSIAVLRMLDIQQLVADWRASLASLPKARAFLSILEPLVQAFTAQTSGDISTVRQCTSLEHRAGASARILVQDFRGAIETAQAQWVLSYILFSTPLRSKLRTWEAVSPLFAKQWEQLVKRPALLVSPRVTVPMLQSAMATGQSMSQQLLRLAITAESASGAAMPEATAMTLRSIVDQERARDASIARLTRARTSRNGGATNRGR
ncbi:hypothetical protein WDZ92_17040 [Nostoc sp. NIES-2111]